MTDDRRFSPRLLEVSQGLLELLNKNRPRTIHAPEARPAAVLMPLWDDGECVRMVFTKRNNNLPQHAGQISFPGGMADPEDPDLEHTALRETDEEIGVPPEKVGVLRPMDQVVTITRFVVTPYLGLLASGVDFNPNPVEVERMVMVPLAKVLNPAAYHERDILWRDMMFRQTALEEGGDVIWGATMRMLQNFLAALQGDASAVARAAGGCRA